jgi:hypothetical protein
MRVIARGTVFASRPGSEFQSCAFPQVCVLPGGRWMVGFRAAPTKASTRGQRSLLTWSDDEGRSWSPPVEPFIPPPVDGKPGLFRAVALTPLGAERLLAVLYWVDHSDPALPFFNETTEGLLDSRVFFSRSEDAGSTWSKPERMDTDPFLCPTAITGPVLVLANGELACQFETNKHYHDTSPWQHASVLMFSSDGGASWPGHCAVASDPEKRIFWWDQRPAVLPDGRVLDLFWTYDRQAAAYLNIHARESADHGRTWSELWDTGVPGQPAPTVPLPDGTLGMVYVDRTAAPVIKMRSSRDRGRSWPDDSEVVIQEASVPSQTWRKGTMQDAWAEMGKFSVGLPATAVAPNGDILVVYYSGPVTDQTDVLWARLRSGPTP